MHWDVTAVRIIGERVLQVEFADGSSGRVVFLPVFFEGVFAPLRDPQRFAEVFLDHGAVAWPGGLDLAPDAMYDAVRSCGEMVCSSSEADVTA